MAAYTRFTPNNSEQRLHPPYYRGCWHGVSRCFLLGYRQEVKPHGLLVLVSSTPLLGFHIQPINVVVYDGPSGG
jgi:hypothetical protein